ncbi:MAG: hypothetical protein K0S24_3260, partial [Sphingobacterium sp.]|nr:hypothetical protein [Sphingobacterium sp.]
MNLYDSFGQISRQLKRKYLSFRYFLIKIAFVFDITYDYGKEGICTG